MAVGVRMRAANHTHRNHWLCVPLGEPRSAGLWEGLSTAANANEFWQPPGTVGSLRTARDGEKWLGLCEVLWGSVRRGGQKDGEWRAEQKCNASKGFQGGYDFVDNMALPLGLRKNGNKSKVGCWLCSGLKGWIYSHMEMTCLETFFQSGYTRLLATDYFQQSSQPP